MGHFFLSVMPALLSTWRDWLFHGNWNWNSIFQLKHPKETPNNEAHSRLMGGNGYLEYNAPTILGRAIFWNGGAASLWKPNYNQAKNELLLYSCQIELSLEGKNHRAVYPDIDSLLLSNPGCSVKRNSGVNTSLLFHAREDQYLQYNSGTCNYKGLAALAAG